MIHARLLDTRTPALFALSSEILPQSAGISRARGVQNGGAGASLAPALVSSRHQSGQRARGLAPALGRSLRHWVLALRPIRAQTKSEDPTPGGFASHRPGAI